MSIGGLYSRYVRDDAKGGVFCVCFYIKGENKRTDWLIDHVYTTKGFFTPSFETRKNLVYRLKALYQSVDIETIKSMVCYKAVK